MRFGELGRLRQARALRRVVPTLAALALAALPLTAEAIEAFDGRLQVHGAVSQEFRTLADGYRVRDHYWFMSKMATKLSVEIEAEILPNGFGPIDILEGFVRFDFEYDCIWDHACHMQPHWNYFGDDARRAPENWANGRTRGVTGVVPNPLQPVEREQPDNRLITVADIDPFSTLLRLGSPEDVATTFANILPAKVTSKHVKGSLSPLVFGLGPINPEYEIDSIGSLIDVPIANQADLPMRPLATPCAPGQRSPCGLFVPSAALERFRDDYDNPDVNFTENELAWNLGASQQQTKFLREAYLDMTMMDGRLVFRLGKQITRWGKTELFRGGTPDQLNPQDFAISNLPSFEDSLIALWQARMVASFYQVGPFEDVRLELVANLDHFEPSDVGDCGEPYTVFLVCLKQFGLLAHGFSGLGVAGELRPPNFWEDAKGLEFGARLEFRVGRFSVSVTDFYGYDDFPTPDYFYKFERNVDPETGRPRVAGGTGPCITGDEPDCLQPGRIGPGNAFEYHSGNRQLFDTTCKATQNLEIPGSLGALLPITSCVISIFTNTDVISIIPMLLEPTVPELLGQMLADGDYFADSILCLVTCPGVFGKTPSGPGFDPTSAGIPLHPGLGDTAAGAFSNIGPFPGFSGFLSPEQQALLGCGPLYSSSTFNHDCNRVGIDLYNIEASVIFQAFPQTEHGRVPLDGAIATRFIPGVGVVQLPGARSVFTYFDDPVGFRWSPVVDGCVVGLSNLDAWQPGYGTAVYNDLLARGLTPQEAAQCDLDAGDHGGNGGDPTNAADAANLATWDGYLVPVPDGLHPANYAFFDQTGAEYTVDEIRRLFPTEMAVVSENLVRLLVGISRLIDPTSGCSITEPLRCDFLNSLFETSAVQRPELRAGGNGVYGRRDMSWLSGSAVQLFYERRNVLGVSVDFAEDRTKTTWGIDFTWIEDAPYINNRADRGYSLEDTLNLTLSIDRPTFINFLSANRTIFFNTQLFLRYIPNYERRDTFEAHGPFALLGTFTAFTGFWQDRLMTFLTLVHEVESNSGGQIFTISYRFSESFSATVGLSTFYGEPSRARVLDRSPVTRFHCCDYTGRTSYQGVSAIAERDELFFVVRKTF